MASLSCGRDVELVGFGLELRKGGGDMDLTAVVGNLSENALRALLLSLRELVDLVVPVFFDNIRLSIFGSGFEISSPRSGLLVRRFFLGPSA